MRVVLGLALLALLGPACKKPWKCEAKGLCSADPAPVAWAVAECNGKLADAQCGRLYRAWMQCQWDHVSCDASGHADVVSAAAACKSEGEGYLQCVGLLDEGHPPRAAGSASAAPLPAGHPPLPHPAAR